MNRNWKQEEKQDQQFDSNEETAPNYMKQKKYAKLNNRGKKLPVNLNTHIILHQIEFNNMSYLIKEQIT